MDAQAAGIEDIHIVQIVIQLRIDSRRPGGVPAEDITEQLAEHLRRAFAALHPLPYESGIEDRGARFYGQGFPVALQPACISVAIVGEKGVRLLAGDAADGQ